MLNLNYIQSVFGVRIRLLVIVLLTMPFAVSGQNVNLNFYVGDTKIKTVSVEAGVTEGVNWQQPDSLITPIANMSFYAVFSKENAHHFVRVTTICRPMATTLGTRRFVPGMLRSRSLIRTITATSMLRSIQQLMATIVSATDT